MKNLGILVLAACGLIMLAVTPKAQAGAIRSLPGFSTYLYGANDDGTYPCTGDNDGEPTNCTPSSFPIGFDITFYGTTFNQVFINNNGNVTFDDSLADFTPYGLAGTSNEIVAAYFSDVDTRAGNYVTFGNDTVDGHQAFGVNWIGVGYFYENTDKLNSFQLILINRSDRNPGDFDIEFNYDQIQWETGDASGGSDGLGGDSAVVGFSNGTGLPGTFFQLAGSQQPGEFLDNNPGGLISGSLNTNVLGRYIIPIINLANTNLDVPPINQGDPRWDNMTYDDSDATIQQMGCALTVLAMALNYEGVTTDPKALNTLLKNHHDFIGPDINWDAATRDASGDTLEFHAHRATDTQYLSEILAKGYPVVVGVNLDANGIPGHFVLVTGFENGQFLISDPGHNAYTTLDSYNEDFETRGYVGDPPGDVSGFDISIDDAADILVTDPTGRQTGYSPATGTVREEIPQSVHFLDNLENNDLTGEPGTNTAHSVIIFQPSTGQYQITVTGIRSEAYTLMLRAFEADGTPETPIVLQGRTGPGGGIIFAVNLTSSGLTLVPAAPQIINQPADQTVAPGGSATFAVAVSGTPPLSYQWSKAGSRLTDGGHVSGSTAAALTINNVSLADKSEYSVTVSNAYGTATSAAANLILSYVLNGGFETGDFTSWSLVDPSFATFVDDGSFTFIDPHSGTYFAALGTDGSLGYLSQDLPTIPGQSYMLSVWLQSPDGVTPNEFQVTWDGTTYFDEVDMGVTGWTNLRYVVTASSDTTTLQLGFEDDYSYLALDDISVSPIAGLAFQTISRANNTLTFVWNAIAGKTYQLQYKTSLSQANWVNLGGTITASGDFATTTDVAPADPRRYYRLTQLP